MNEISQRARELLATVDMIETRPIEWPFSDEQTPPIWRIELDGYCADFEHSEAANNFALAINARIEKALSPLPSGDDLVERLQRIERFAMEMAGKYHSDLRCTAIATDARAVIEAIASIPGRGWQGIESAPKDGTSILAWCVHPHAEYSTKRDEYQAAVVTHWIDHNGGGWTWYGLSGRFTHWRPLPDPPSLKSQGGEKTS